jgi:hypothetical protein
MGIFIPDSDFRKYEKAAANLTSITQGGNLSTLLQNPQAQGDILVMAALYQTMLVKVNGLIQKINSNLLAAQNTHWGKNIPYNNTTANTISFGNSLTLDDGIVKLISDYAVNEAVGTPQIVGNGLVTQYDILQRLKVGIDKEGFGSNPLNVYSDFGSISKWGANHFGVFVPGLTAFVDYERNVGSFAGVRGSSIFFTLPIPVQLANGTLTKLVLDCQLKYDECPTKNDDGDIVSGRGWKLIMSKYYGLFNAPEDTVAATDRMNGFNGSLHYIGQQQ